jgi:hypothetical protein
MVGRPRPWMKMSTLHGLSDGNLLCRLSFCQSRASLPIFERAHYPALGLGCGPCRSLSTCPDAAHIRILEKVGQSESGPGTAFCALQFLQDSQFAQNNSGNGSRDHRPCVGHRRFNRLNMRLIFCGFGFWIVGVVCYALILVGQSNSAGEKDLGVAVLGMMFFPVIAVSFISGCICIAVGAVRWFRRPSPR